MRNIRKEKAVTRLKSSYIRIIALGFLLLISLGTFLLMLPVSAVSGRTTSFPDALFTAVSASCVTGLVVVDTYTHWSFFGQLVILALIQIGGLGFITIGVYIAVLMKKRIGLWEREAVNESISSMQVAGAVRLTKRIIQGTLIIEGLAAVILMTRFIPMLGWAEGVFYGFFHAISAFCNAGFDLMGRFEPYSSLCLFQKDTLVNAVIMSVILLGGLGFLVWDDIAVNRLNLKRYMLHTKLVLVITAILVFGSAFIFFIVEKNHTLSGVSLKEGIISSLFMAVTPRTAGFNTVDLTSMSDTGKLLTILLMFIGGNSGSTAGGVKTTTVAAILLASVSLIRSSQGTNIFGRRLYDEDIRKAATVFFMNLSLALMAILIITAIQPLEFLDVCLEVFSAIGTVGMSTGITRELNIVSRVIIMILMYCGRLGSLSFVLLFSNKLRQPPIQNPKEKILVG